MDQLLSILLTLLLNYGYPVVTGLIILSYVGVPIPLNAVILAAGAFSAAGVFRLEVLIPLVLLGAVTGDTIGYAIGKKFGAVIASGALHAVGLTTARLNSTALFLNHFGAASVFFTRWLFTPIGIPVNILVGSTGTISFRVFFLSAVAGEALWATLYIGSGYYLGANWVLILDYLSNFSSLLTGAALSLALIYFGVTRLQKIRARGT